MRLLDLPGFVEIRQRGPRQKSRDADGRFTTVPFHEGRDISPVLLRRIASDTGLTPDRLLEGREA